MPLKIIHSTGYDSLNHCIVMEEPPFKSGDSIFVCRENGLHDYEVKIINVIRSRNGIWRVWNSNLTLVLKPI